jgi:hypothetical protein
MEDARASVMAVVTNCAAVVVGLGAAVLFFPSLACFVLLVPAVLGTVGVFQGVKSHASRDRESIERSAELTSHLAVLNGSLLGIFLVIALGGALLLRND